MISLQFFSLQACLDINGYCLLYSPLVIFQFHSSTNFLFYSQEKKRKKKKEILMAVENVTTKSHQLNYALVAIWIRRFLHELEALWRKLIVAKYYSPCLWPSIVRRSAKSMWRFICHTVAFVASYTQCCLGTGSTISL